MGQTFCKETNRNISCGGCAIVYILKLPASMLSHNQSGTHISESTIRARDGFANGNVMSLFCNRAWLIFRAKKYNVMNKQTDTVALFSGH